jgi:hypothetical protein
MQQAVVLTGREASRARRQALSQGKGALPPPAERTRVGKREAALPNVKLAPSSSTSSATLPADSAVGPEPAVPPRSTASGESRQVTASSLPPAVGFAGLSGRALSMARRRALSQGKAALKQWQAPVGHSTPAAITTSRESLPGMTVVAATEACTSGSCRDIAKAVRAERARNGRGGTPPARPSGRMRPKSLLKYPPKVVDSFTYERHKVTGLRIGRGTNVTGDEAGASLPVTGTQYIGLESGYMPRPGGVKVGAARTPSGLVVTGTQVRSKVRITGDESNPRLRITGEADQEPDDDLLPREDEGVYTATQFQRMHNPHGHSVFGMNIGRSITSVGSRTRERPRNSVAELTEGGRIVTGTAVGRSPRVTGDEPGACRQVTGDQYLTPAALQPLCSTPQPSYAPKVGLSQTLSGTRVSGTQVGQRLRGRGGITGTAEEGVCVAVSGDEYLGAEQYHGLCGAVPEPASGEKVPVSETWRRQRVTGVAVEQNPKVTGDEPGACATVTGTPYVGPAQYETYCADDDVAETQQRVTPAYAGGHRVTGDTPINVEQVTGTQRGAERPITGTPYYRHDIEKKEEAETNAIERIHRRFSVSSPQREAQLRAGKQAVEAPTAAARITGSFALGEGKITGNQEFHFSPRPPSERPARVRVTGEGRVEGPRITGSAWDENPKVTGTEDYIAAERNPSERGGPRRAFASAGVFKGKGRQEEPKQLVTGMVGWSPKSTARITLSGGAQG